MLTQSCIQKQIFEPSQVAEFNRSLAELDRKLFSYLPPSNRYGLKKNQPESHRYMNPNDSWFPVVFDNEGSIQSENVTLPYRDCPNLETIKKVAAVSIEWMANQMSWKNETRLMATSIIQHYKLDKEEKSEGISWHRDLSDHSLVILMDDESQWSGGEFQFKTKNGQVLTYTPKCAFGVLFSNGGTQHCVQPFTSLGDKVNRTILTIHESSGTEK